MNKEKIELEKIKAQKTKSDKITSLVFVFAGLIIVGCLQLFTQNDIYLAFLGLMCFEVGLFSILYLKK